MILLAFLFIATLATGQQGSPSDCETERARFHELVQEHAVRGPTYELLEASKALKGCPSAPKDSWDLALGYEIYLLQKLGHPDETLQVIDDLFERHMASASRTRVLHAYETRARIHEAAGRIADAVFDRVSAVDFAREMPAAVQLTPILNLSGQYDRLQAFDLSRELFAQSLKLAAEGSDRVYEAYLHAWHADAILGDWLRGSKRDSTDLYQALSQAMASVDYLNHALLEQGKNPSRQDSTRIFRAKTVLYRTLFMVSDTLGALRTAESLTRWASVDWTQMEAAYFYASALRLVGEVERSVEILLAARTLPIAADFIEVNDQLGRSLAALGRWDEAEEAYRRAISVREEEQGTLGASPLAGLAIDELRLARHALASILIRRGEVEESFELLDRARARSLRNALVVAELAQKEPHRMERFMAIHDEIRALRDSARVSGAPSRIYAIRRAELEAALTKLVADIRPRHHTAAKDLQAQLRSSGRVLLSYHLGTESFVFVVTADTLAAIPIDVPHELLLANVEQIDRMKQGSGAAEIDAYPLRRLHDAVFAPVKHLVPAGAPVTVISEGLLSEVPFGMLLEDEGRRFQYAEWPFLMRRNPFSTELAASLLLDYRPSHGDGGITAFGRTAFGPFQARAGQGTINPDPLPHVRSEIASIRRRVPRGDFVMEAAATRERFLESVTGSKVVHVASHVFVDAGDPQNSAILFASAEGLEREHPLYMSDLIGRLLPVDLIVLSACDSGTGLHRRSEGAIGLQYAFRQTGAASTLATMWSVDDAATAFLMERFYKHLVEGEPKDVALQLAQTEFLQSHELLSASPFYWAGFFLSGDPAPVYLRSGHRTPRYWVGLSFLLLTLAGIVASRAATSTLSK